MRRLFLLLLVVPLVIVSCSQAQKIVLEAEDMEPNEGIQSFTREKDHVRMNARGEIKGMVTFPRDGQAHFLVRVKGEAGGGAYPTVLIKLGGEEVASIDVESDDWHLLGWNAEVSKGPHEISLAYINDYYAPPEDRNLLVDKIIIDLAGE